MLLMQNLPCQIRGCDSHPGTENTPSGRTTRRSGEGRRMVGDLEPEAEHIERGVSFRWGNAHFSVARR
jgi:hypothetical protein